MQFSCPVVSIRIEFQRGVLKDTERLKAPVLLDGTCRVPLENQSAALFASLEKSVAQPTAPRSKICCSAYCAALEKSHIQPYARPSPPAQTLTLSRLRRPSRVPADPLRFPACTGPYAFPLAPDRFSFRYDLFLPYQNWPHIRTLSRRLYDRVLITTQRE